MFRFVSCSTVASVVLATSLNSQTATFIEKIADVKDGTFNLQSPAVADMNEDGIPDIVSVTASSLSGPRSLSILVSSGPGIFKPQPNQYSIPTSPENGVQPMVADLNKDGHLDVVVPAPDLF